MPTSGVTKQKGELLSHFSAIQPVFQPAVQPRVFFEVERFGLIGIFFVVVIRKIELERAGRDRGAGALHGAVSAENAAVAQ